MEEFNSPPKSVTPVIGAATPTSIPGMDADREVRRQRARNYFLALARRAEANPEAADVLSSVLAGRVAEYWEPAFEAAMQAAENFEFAHVHPVIDEVIAKSLREKPDLNLIAELYNRIPLDTVLLKETGLEVFRQTVKAMENRNRVELHPAGYITLVLNLVARLTQAEQMNEAEELAKKALELSRKKHSEDANTFNGALINSLESMAIILSTKGEYQKCKEVRDEAIRLLRNTPGSERDFAQCLNNYAGILMRLGDDVGALAQSQESVRLYRNLVEDAKPEGTADFSKGLDAWVEDPRPNLAKALVGLSSYQDKAKLHQECHASAKEAFDLFFTLSQEFPDQFLDAFGLARHNLGMAKLGIGDREGGLREFQEAAVLFGNLAKINFIVYGPTYAHMLDSVMRGLVKSDRNEEALARVVECLGVYRSLNEKTSGRYAGKVREWLEILKGFYEDLGRPEKAKEVATELAHFDQTIQQAPSPAT